MPTGKCIAMMAAAVLLVAGAASATRAAPYASAELSFNDLTLTGVLGNPAVSILGSTVANISAANYAAQASYGTSAVPGQDVSGQRLQAASTIRGDAQIAGAIGTDDAANVAGEPALTAVPGAASATAGTSAGVSLAVTSATAVLLGFTASSRLTAATTGPGEGASAQTTASLMVNRGGTTIASLVPEALNVTVNSKDGTADSMFSSAPTSYSTGPLTLDPGTYQIQLLSDVQERSTVSNIPEPTSTALLGAGLVSLGFVRRRA